MSFATRRDALIGVIETLHAEIAALKVNDVAALESATADKLAAINAGVRLAAIKHRINGSGDSEKGFFGE